MASSSPSGFSKLQGRGFFLPLLFSYIHRGCGDCCCDKVFDMRDWLVSLARDLASITFLLAAVALPVALVLSHVETQYRIAEAGYEIAEVTREHRQLTEDYKKLKIEAAVQGRTERMSEVARQRFGLEPTRPEQVTIIHLDNKADALEKLERHASLEMPR